MNNASPGPSTTVRTASAGAPFPARSSCDCRLAGCSRGYLRRARWRQALRLRACVQMAALPARIPAQDPPPWRDYETHMYSSSHCSGDTSSIRLWPTTWTKMLCDESKCMRAVAPADAIHLHRARGVRGVMCISWRVCVSTDSGASGAHAPKACGMGCTVPVRAHRTAAVLLAAPNVHIDSTCAAVIVL